MNNVKSGISKSSHQKSSIKIGVLKNLAKFTGKHFCWSLFPIKLQALGLFIKKRPQHRCFPVHFAKFLRTFIFIEHHWWLLLNNNEKKDFLGSRHPYQITAFFLSLLFPFLNTTYTKIYGRQILLKKTISLHLNLLNIRKLIRR